MPIDRRLPGWIGWLLLLLAIGSSGAGQEDDAILGAPAALEPPSATTERLEVAIGTPIFTEPNSRSMILVRVDARIDLEVLERRGDWTQVLFGAWRGWIQPPSTDGDAQPVSTSASPPPPTSKFERDSTRQRLEQAAAQLGVPAETVPWGTFQLLTDVEDPRLLERAERIAAGLAATYHQRFGVSPGEPPNGIVVLFRSEEDYRAYEHQDPLLTDLDVRGHAAGDLALFFVDPGELEATTSILVHELTHLLNRRALGPRLAPWLEEGLANDLSFSRIDRHGALDPGSLNGRIRTTETPIRTRRGRGSWYSFTISGATAALTKLAARIDQRQVPPLSDLFDLPAESFVDPVHREANYSQSTFVVRYLLDGDRGRHAAGFRRFLAALPQGADDDAETLQRHLDTTLPKLQRGFEQWVRRQARSLQF